MGYDGPVEPANYGASRRPGPLMDVLVFAAGALPLLLLLLVGLVSLVALAAFNAFCAGLGQAFFAGLGQAFLWMGVAVVSCVLFACLFLMSDWTEWLWLDLLLLSWLAGMAGPL